MTKRFTTRDYLVALGHGARLLARHRGDLGEVMAELNREKEWARFRARHGLNDIHPALMATMDPPTDAEIQHLLHPQSQHSPTPEQAPPENNPQG